MGGGEVLYYAASGPAEVRKEIRGYIALAPYILLHPKSQPSRALELAGRLAMKFLPKLQVVQKLRPDILCRDPEVAASWEQDELCHNTGTLEGLGGMIDRGEELDKGRVVIEERSVYIAQGSGDFITSPDASKRLFENLKIADKTYQSYEGWYHVCELIRWARGIVLELTSVQCMVNQERIKFDLRMMCQIGSWPGGHSWWQMMLNRVKASCDIGAPFTRCALCCTMCVGRRSPVKPACNYSSDYRIFVETPWFPHSGPCIASRYTFWLGWPQKHLLDGTFERHDHGSLDQN